MSETTEKQLDAIEAQIELLRVQVKALRHGLKPAPMPSISIELPLHCEGIEAARCAIRSEDARLSQASLTHPHRWVCRGCRAVSEDGRATT